MLWEHEVVGSNPTAPTKVREPIRAARGVVASAGSLTHLRCARSPARLRLAIDSAGLADGCVYEPIRAARGVVAPCVRPSWVADGQLDLPDRDVDQLDGVVAHALVVPRDVQRLDVAVGVGRAAGELVVAGFGGPVE